MAKGMIFDRTSISDEPDVVVVWDPELMTPEEYADLVVALGDVVRAHGGVGLTMLQSESCGIECGEGVHQ